MTDAKAILEGLTEAQKRALLCAKIDPPHAILPNYYAVEISIGNMNGTDVNMLQALGLVTLPIRLPSSWTYAGEIHPLGLQVRALIEESANKTPLNEEQG